MYIKSNKSQGEMTFSPWLFVIIFEKIANPKKEEGKPTLFSKIKKKLFKAGTNVLLKRTEKPINIELLELINDLGEDLNLLYSKNEIAFNKKYKKIKKGSDINV